MKRQYQGLFNRKVGSKDIWNFWQESWFNAIRNTQNEGVFYRKEGSLDIWNFL